MPLVRSGEAVLTHASLLTSAFVLLSRGLAS